MSAPPSSTNTTSESPSPTASSSSSAPAQTTGPLQRMRDERFAAARALLADDKLFLAKTEIDALLAALLEKAEAGDAAARELHAAVLEDELVVELERAVADVNHIVLDMEQDEEAGWEEIGVHDGIRTQYRAEGGSGLFSFKVDGVIDAPLLHIASCLYEVDMFSNWFPMLKASHDILTVSRFHKVCGVEVGVPWPFANRETIVDAHGYDMLETGMVVIVMRSLTKEQEVEMNVPPEKKGVVRCEMTIGGFLLEPISPTSCRLRLMANVNPMVPVIPYSLINWFTGKVIHFIVARLRTCSATFHGDDEPGAMYLQRIKANPSVYEYIEQLVAHHFKEDDNE